jgi:hypothetical protein
VIVIHVALLVAVHAQADPVVTVTGVPATCRADRPEVGLIVARMASAC